MLGQQRICAGSLEANLRQRSWPAGIRRMFSVNTKRTLSECRPKVNAHIAFIESLNKCSANAQRLFAEHSSHIHISHANELSANVFCECLAYVRRMFGEYLICIIIFFSVNAWQMFQRMLGDWSANIHEAFPIYLSTSCLRNVSCMLSELTKKLYSANAKGNLFSEHSPYMSRNFQRLLTFTMYLRIIRHAFAKITFLIRVIIDSMLGRRLWRRFNIRSANLSLSSLSILVNGPSNTRPWPNAAIMLAHRLLRWTNIKHHCFN